MGDCSRTASTTAASNLKKHELGDKFDVADDRCFVGFDAYKKVIDSGVDLVILATPPGFRPMHLEAAVEAGKHIFTEKPVGVDGPGIRKVLAAAEEAKKKNLAVVAGTQRRHQAGYLESMKRIHDGAIGDLDRRPALLEPGRPLDASRASRAGATWSGRSATGSTSPGSRGDHIVEQHVHNLDVVNWAIGAPPGPRRRHGRPPGPHRPRLRQHLRPLRRRLRIPQRRPRA